MSYCLTRFSYIKPDCSWFSGSGGSKRRAYDFRLKKRQISDNRYFFHRREFYMPSNLRPGTIAEKKPLPSTTGSRCPSYTNTGRLLIPLLRGSRRILSCTSSSISGPISLQRLTSTTYAVRGVWTRRSIWQPAAPPFRLLRTFLYGAADSTVEFPIPRKRTTSIA